jgi:hypothetical protein
MPDNINSVTVSHAVLGIVVTIFLSVSGSYVTVLVSNARIETRVKHNEKNIEDLKSDSRKRDEQYLQILTKLTDIQVKLEGKKDRE